MLKRIAAVMLVMLIIPAAIAQKPKQFVKLGDKSFNEGDFYGASIYYKKALNSDSTRLELIYKYAESLRGYNEYAGAARVYQKIFKIDRGTTYPEAQFWLATMQKFNAEYDEAKKNFKEYSKTCPNQRSFTALKANHEVNSCDFAKKLMRDTVDVNIKNLGSGLNTFDSEFSAFLFGDSVLYFSSLHSDSLTDENEVFDPAYYVSLYQARKVNGEWANVSELDSVINDPAFHNANATLSPDGNRLYFSRCSGEFKCMIWMSRKEDGAWQKPEKLDAGINPAGYSTTQPMLAIIDGEEVLFFASDRPQSRGGLDIWYSIVKNEGKTYSTPVNPGTKINSIDDEISPFYDAKNKLLYFSSGWHYGLGGFDIFKSEMNGLENFGRPENLGFELNTSVNDFYFSIDPETESGFLTSNRKGSITRKGETCCNDIYYFSKPEEIIVEVVEQDDLISTLEEINRYLPLTLYFHNDEPNPRTRDTLTSLSYLETYDQYKAMTGTYMEEYSRGMTGEDKTNAQNNIADFFSDYVDKGVKDLDRFTGMLLAELEKGQRIELTIKGYASPLARSDYNVNLTLRRISSLINLLKTIENGSFVPYLDGMAQNGGLLKIVKVPFGEFKAAHLVSDNLNDRKNSIYSRAAALERKIEIVSVTQADADSWHPEITFERHILNFGYIGQGEEFTGTFRFKNTGKKYLKITEVEADCGCTVANWPKKFIKPGQEGEIEVKFTTSGLKGKQVKTITVISNAMPSIRTITITAEVQ